LGDDGLEAAEEEIWSETWQQCDDLLSVDKDKVTRNKQQAWTGPDAS
jgi:hypothetical protein